MGASESKLEFKEDIFRLAGEENIPVNSQWWVRFLQLPETAEDVQALWSPNDLRSLTLNTPADRPLPHTHGVPKKNVETLIYRIVGRLHILQTKRQPEETPIAPEVLNGVRILTRLLPYVYEAEHLHRWEEEFFWTPRRPASYNDPEKDEQVYLDGLDPGKIIPEERKDAEIGPPLGEQLVDILINYLFFPGFTLPPKTDANGHPQLTPIFMVWQSGIGANKGAGMTKENERNAMELLRLLLALCSRSMYVAPNFVAENDVKPLTYLTTQSDRAIVLNTICSLLNTVLKYNQNPWSFPIGLTGVMLDSKQPLVTYSLQFLLVLITYPVPDGGTNEFRKQLSRLHRAEDFQFIVEGLRQILMQPASGVFRPVQRLTTTVPPIAPETLALFWELLQCNKRFRSYLIDTDRCRDFVVLVLYYAIEAKDDPAKQGIVRMCVFILQTLSVEEKFGRKLNVPFAFQETLPGVLQMPNFHGTYADFLIGHIHTLLTSQSRGIESLHPALLAVINNIAPYVQDLGRATSSMLLNVFAMMSAPSFLLANETNHVLLFSLLDAMNAILEHQYGANRRFVEAVVKSRKRFQALRGFTVEGALAEVDRMTMERKDHASSEPSGVRSPSLRNNSLDSARSPVSARSTQLGNVPEHGAFAIGNDDEDEDEAESLADGVSTPTSASASVAEDFLPMQSRSMSEKARGKQPIGQGSFSRSTSRNSSHSSLTALSTLQSTSTSLYTFTPTPQWLHTWLPHLPLHKILKTIENAKAAAFFRTAEAGDASAIPATTTKHTNGVEKRDEPEETKEVKVQGFKWTSLSLGWYMSLLWGFTYAYDAGMNKGANGIWHGTHIKLFNVLSQKHDITLRSPRGAIDAVGDTIARRVSSLSFQSSQTIKEV